MKVGDIVKYKNNKYSVIMEITKINDDESCDLVNTSYRMLTYKNVKLDKLELCEYNKGCSQYIK